MAKNLEVTFLMDFYGDMLTKKQYAFLEYYYHDDLSLGEIAQNEGISRQGVRDAIKRAEAQLFDMEERLGLSKRFLEMRKTVEQIVADAQEINELNKQIGLSSEIDEKSIFIQTAARSLLEKE